MSVKNIVVMIIIAIVALSQTACVGLSLHSEKLNGTASSEIWFAEDMQGGTLVTISGDKNPKVEIKHIFMTNI